MSRMRFVDFLGRLLLDGRAEVPGRLGPLDAGERQAGGEFLVDFEVQYRATLPGTPPRLNVAAAVWAAERFLQACQFLVLRELPAEAMDDLWAEDPWGGSGESEVHYSVDLSYRFLPDLWRQARIASTADPLLVHLLGWSVQWPLSSVGVADVRGFDLAPIQRSPSLVTMYVDRIITRRDHQRLTEPRTRQWIGESLGMHSHLAGELASNLSEQGER